MVPVVHAVTCCQRLRLQGSNAQYLVRHCDVHSGASLSMELIVASRVTGFADQHSDLSWIPQSFVSRHARAAGVP